MAANTTPIFTLTPHVGQVETTGANTSLAGTGSNVMTVISGTTNGTTIENIHVKSVGTSTAGMIRLFLYDGTNTYLWHEIPVSAISQSGTVATFEADWVPANTLFVLPSGWSIKATTNNADSGYIIVATGGDY